MPNSSLKYWTIKIIQYVPIIKKCLIKTWLFQAEDKIEKKCYTPPVE